MKNALFWALLLCPYVISGQFYDDFSHGLSAWSGDTSKFEIDPDGRLRLNDHQGGLAKISRSVTHLDTNIWSGSLRLDFQPSAANQLRLFFQSSDMMNKNGWFAEIGESGQQDSLRFYVTENGQHRFLGAMFLESFSNGEIDFDYHIWVDKDALYISMTDVDGYLDTLNLTTDILLTPPFFFQLECQYTSTRATKFSFDDIAVGALKIDSIPVEIVEIDIISSQTILVRFSEQVDTTSIGNIQLTGMTSIADFSFSQDALSLQLHTEDALVSGEWYELLFEDISDLNGNGQDTMRSRFQYKEIINAGQYDLLITELMADPQPVVAMPDCEYIELYNRTDKYIQLADYTIADLTRQAFLPEFLLAPNTYVALCDESCLQSLAEFGPALAVKDLPSLNNDADHISIVDFAGRIVHHVPYDRSWYGDASRSEGGWSLEMISTENVCAARRNWKAAQFETCGTPGKSNSVGSQNISLDSLKLVRAVASSGFEIEVIFSHEILNQADVLNAHLSHGIGIDNKEIVNEKVLISLADSLDLGTGYQLVLSDVLDCLYRPANEEFEAIVYRPRQVDSSQLIINEVLFDGTSQRPEYIELHNTTSSFLRVDRLCLEARSSSDTTLECLNFSLVIEAGGFIVWTEDTSALLQQFARNGRLLQWPLPRLDDDHGMLDLFVYIQGKRRPLDQALYRSGWHSPILTDAEGVSLERRRYAMSGLTRDNWHSASSLDNFGSPGRINSQWVPTKFGEDLIQVSDRSFSPNGDGHKDIMEVQINPDKAGYNLRLDVYDLEGHFIRRLSNDELINGPNFFVWDGSDQNGHVQSIGVYLILLEMGHPNGELHREKVSVILN